MLQEPCWFQETPPSSMPDQLGAVTNSLDCILHERSKVDDPLMVGTLWMVGTLFPRHLCEGRNNNPITVMLLEHICDIF